MEPEPILRDTAEMVDDRLWFNSASGLYYIRDIGLLKTGESVDLYSLSREGGVRIGYAQIGERGTAIYAHANLIRYSVPVSVLTTGHAPVIEVVQV